MSETAKRNEKVIEAVKTILSELNGGNRKEIAASIVETVESDHRTLQQNFWTAMLLAQCEYASALFDPRNEDSVKLANKVKELAVANNWDSGLRYI